jgi:hypothetical protein
MGGQRIFRVTVRGRFSDPDDRARAYLRSNLESHDVSRSGYTAEGTFTYDRRIDAFSLRYEVRLGADQPEESAAARGIRQAEQFLGVMGFPHGDLRSSVTDVAGAWARQLPDAGPPGGAA